MKCIQYQPLSVLQLPAHTGVPEQREYILPVHNPEWAGYSKSTIGTKIRDSFLTCFMYDTLFVTIKVRYRCDFQLFLPFCCRLSQYHFASCVCISLPSVNDQHPRDTTFKSNIQHPTSSKQDWQD